MVKSVRKVKQQPCHVERSETSLMATLALPKNQLEILRSAQNDKSHFGVTLQRFNELTP